MKRNQQITPFEIQNSLVIMKYYILCRLNKMSSEECLSISEFEFTLVEGKIAYMETWSNGQRTKGYRKWDVSAENLKFPFATSWTDNDGPSKAA